MALPEYPYRPLESPGSIRLLKILPDRVDGNIACTLEHFDQGRIPPYHALSYFWGDPQQTRLIYLRDAAHDTGHIDPASITPTPGFYQQGLHENLWEVLDQMHTMNRTQDYYWTDFLCLNQASEMEMAEQIGRMGEIYSGTAGTISWLGRPTSNYINPFNDLEKDIIKLSEWYTGYHKQAEQLFANFDRLLPEWFLVNVADRTNASVGINRGPPESLAVVVRNAKLPEIKSQINGIQFARIHNPLYNILKLPYWTRVWIVQEVALAPSVEIIFGSQSINSDILILAYKTYIGYFLNKYQTVPVIEARITRDYIDFSIILRWFRRCNCSKAVDRLYGFMGLLNSNKHNEGMQIKHLEVNYKKEFAELYWDLVFGCVSDSYAPPLAMFRDLLSHHPTAETLQAYASNPRTSLWHKHMAMVSVRAAEMTRAIGTTVAQGLFPISKWEETNGFFSDDFYPDRQTPNRLESWILNTAKNSEMDKEENNFAITVGMLLQLEPRFSGDYDGEWSCQYPGHLNLPQDSDPWVNSSNTSSIMGFEWDSSYHKMQRICSFHNSKGSDQVSPPCFGSPRYVDMMEEVGCLFRLRFIKTSFYEYRPGTDVELSIHFPDAVTFVEPPRKVS